MDDTLDYHMNIITGPFTDFTDRAHEKHFPLALCLIKLRVPIYV